MLPLLPGQLWQRGGLQGRHGRQAVVRRLAGRGGEEMFPLLAAASSVGVPRCAMAPIFSALSPWWRAGVVGVVLLPRTNLVRELLSDGYADLFRHPESESMGVGHPLPPLLLAETVSLPPRLPKWLVPRRSAVTSARRQRRWPGVGLGT
jgi:hypothetical protein